MAAYALGIPLDLVTVKESRDITSPNNYATAANGTSESVCYVRSEYASFLKNACGKWKFVSGYTSKLRRFEGTYGTSQVEDAESYLAGVGQTMSAGARRLTFFVDVSHTHTHLYFYRIVKRLM